MFELLALKHPMLVHLPIAAALLLPLPLFLAQRRGLGVKPWWTVGRYLAWMGFLGLLPALLSGLLWAKTLGLIPAGKLLAPAGAAAQSLPWLMRRHQLAALAALAMALATLASLSRPRRDHEGLGKLGLLTGLLWAAAAGMAGFYGGRMAYPVPAAPVASAPAAEAPPDPEADLPVRFLDYASLEPVQRAFVRGAAHGMRWERTWITASASDAFKQGRALPSGSYAVLSTVEDAWGRPAADPGPLYAYEILADGRPSFTVYWGRVPEARRKEFGGDSVYWRKDAPQLKSCLQCHAGGASDATQRVLEPPRPRKPAAAEEAPTP